MRENSEQFNINSYLPFNFFSCASPNPSNVQGEYALLGLTCIKVFPECFLI